MTLGVIARIIAVMLAYAAYRLSIGNELPAIRLLWSAAALFP
jgi:hypothetical protein